MHPVQGPDAPFSKMTRLFLMYLLLFGVFQGADAALDAALIGKLANGESDEKIAAIQSLGAIATPEAAQVLKVLSEDALFVAGEHVFYLKGDQAVDAATGLALVPAPDSSDNVVINNRVRSELNTVLASLKLFDPDVQVRYKAAQALLGDVTADMLPVLTKAVAHETDPAIREMLVLAVAQINLGSPDASVRLAAAQALGESSSPNARNLLTSLIDPAHEPVEAVRHAAQSSLKSVDNRLALSDALARVFTGISLGSILMLAALGLAITYGVMGVINMAHGELLMVGAYATYVTQGWFRVHWPQALEGYVVAAIPVAFLSAALVGMVLERTVIRWLYGRPLETLLATWGLSLGLIQCARLVFGAQNVELANPEWMSGGVALPWGLSLPWNRIDIILFSLFVLALVWVLMNKTRLGLFVRAVTQNRAMAGCMGVPTGLIDTVAFGLGAGIAGLGGVALSQISNVGPDMGQGYIVDSFMVVVLGGVGQLAGAVWAALGLGILSKFLEGWVGAVIAKIILLVFVIIFIQRRPQGLFALKGRFADN